MKKNHIAIIVLLACFGLSSCVKDLEVKPIDPNLTTSATVYDNPTTYKQVLGKCYAGLAVTGSNGEGGEGDIQGIDEGFSSYWRTYWCAQVLTTDEAVIGWGDEGLPDLHNQNWSASNRFTTALYYRIMYEITICNELIRESTDAKLSSRGVTGTTLADVKKMRAEARFLRAFAYWHGLDLYGSIPFVTENDAVGLFYPTQKSKVDLFNYIESELKDIVGEGATVVAENQLADPKTNEYARVDKVAAWTLLAKLYLNANVYTGVDKYTECITYSNKVISSPAYTLDPVFQNIFLADNDKSPEIIFAFASDGQYTRTWGGMNMIIHASIGGKMDPLKFGGDAWNGTRTTKSIVQKFTDPSGATDKRAIFFTDGQSLEIKDVTVFSNGYAVPKFKNVTSTGALPAHYDPRFVDTDIPIFRLADVYLMYAEAVVRGGQGGSTAKALELLNALQARAYGDNNHALTSYTKEFILDERAREMMWEATRRTDLIRFGQFSKSSYVWPWKGGAAEGKSTDEKYNLFPIPSADMAANPNLKQNTGY